MRIRCHGPWALLLAVLGSLACARSAAPQAPISAELSTRADDAALYALPLVIMDLTREQFFANPAVPDITPGRLLHIPILGNPSFRSVVRPNVDTLYSTAWLDLGAGPVMLSAPASEGRYFQIQCMDAWTNVFAAPGIRTLGNRSARLAIVGPDWHGEPPPGAELVRAPTQMVWVLARVYVRDPDDLAAARTFQQQLDVRPLSHVDDPAFRAVTPRAAAAPARRPIMRDRLHALGPEAFYERFTRLTAANPPSPPDPQFTAAVLAPLGIAPGQPIHWASLDGAQRSALAAGLDHVLRAVDNSVQLRQRNALTPTGWSGMAGTGETRSQGNYGTNYRARAVVAAIGLGANLRVDAVYMNASVDRDQQPLDGSKRYRLTFAAGQAPPVHAFWSVTLYDEQGYLVANPLERYAIKSGDNLVREPDGSLVIYLSPDDPGPAHRANWLPTPAHQRFELSLRAYWPGDELLDGRWMPPAVNAQSPL